MQDILIGRYSDSVRYTTDTSLIIPPRAQRIGVWIGAEITGVTANLRIEYEGNFQLVASTGISSFSSAGFVSESLARSLWVPINSIGSKLLGALNLVGTDVVYLIDVFLRDEAKVNK